MTVLYVAWQDPESRRWMPVGRLTLDAGEYHFAYTKGVLVSAAFLPFAQMPKLNAEYHSPDLFPLFQNLLLPKSRPEYRQFLEWLNIRENDADPLALLALTGGAREHESITIFPYPQPSEDETYHIRFFSHGLSHCSGEAVRRVSSLVPGEELFLMPDPQNPADKCALALRTSDPPTIIGYCPRYLASDFLFLLNNAPDVVAAVERVNNDGPLQFRLLCSVTSDWPSHFRPCSGEEYEPVSGQSNNVLVAEPHDAPTVVH